MTRLTEDQITSLFREPRTVSAFTDQPVTDEQLKKIQEIAYLDLLPSTASPCALPG